MSEQPDPVDVVAALEELARSGSAAVKLGALTELARIRNPEPPAVAPAFEIDATVVVYVAAHEPEQNILVKHWHKRRR